MADPIPFRPHAPGTQPPYDAPAYLGTSKRHPRQKLHPLPQTITETTGPQFSPARFPPMADLTMTGGKPAIGERIIVAGTITDEDGRPVPNTMVEIWQCNATGRYDHPADQHDAPLDPNFHGAGRVFTDEQRALPVPDDPAWRVSVAEPQECLAAEPHPFLVFRAGVRDAPGDADVLSRAIRCWRSIRSSMRCRTSMRATG